MSASPAINSSLSSIDVPSSGTTLDSSTDTVDDGFSQFVTQLRQMGDKAFNSSVIDSNGQISISMLIQEMAQMFAQLRNTNQNIAAQQITQQFNIQKAALIQQQQGINDTANAGMAAGIMTAVGGAVAVAGAGASVTAGESAASIGSAVNSMTSGLAKVTEARMSVTGETEKMVSNYQSSLAQQFQKVVDNSTDNAKQMSGLMQSTVSAMTELYGQMLKSVQF